jgi:hypothetical protein
MATLVLCVVVSLSWAQDTASDTNRRIPPLTDPSLTNALEVKAIPVHEIRIGPAPVDGPLTLASDIASRKLDVNVRISRLSGTNQAVKVFLSIGLTKMNSQPGRI